MLQTMFVPGEILLPEDGTDMGKWATLACDQFTSQPAYWQDVEKTVGNTPSTLHMVLPEVYLEAEDVNERIPPIHAAMKSYIASPLTKKVNGFVYVERTLPSGAVRQGLVGLVDLEHYSYHAGAVCAVRPSENTVEARIPPRLAVRRGAVLETPHILMLIDDPDTSVIEPLSGRKDTLAPLYDFDLLYGGGHITGWAVTEKDELERIDAALASLADPDRFAQMYGTGNPPFVFAVGDGNHSLATAKALWEQTKTQLSEEEQASHPARWCLVELENIQSPAIEIEPIHRIVYNMDSDIMYQIGRRFASGVGASLGSEVEPPEGKNPQEFVGLSPKGEFTFIVASSPHPLAVGSIEGFIARLAHSYPEIRVDYIHGEPAVRELVKTQGVVGLLLPPLNKSDLFLGIAQGGVLPKKTFSMGHAEEKRYYLECRKILP